MKKFLTLLLAAAMTLSLAACGSKTDDNSGNNSQPASALELLNAVWANYSDDDKFPAAGGDYDEANMTRTRPVTSPSKTETHLTTLSPSPPRTQASSPTPRPSPT